MGLLVDGHWQDQWYDKKYRRPLCAIGLSYDVDSAYEAAAPARLRDFNESIAGLQIAVNVTPCRAALSPLSANSQSV